MRVTSDFTQDEPFRAYQIAIHVDAKADQDKLRYFFECGQRDSGTQSHKALYADLLEQLED